MAVDSWAKFNVQNHPTGERALHKTSSVSIETEMMGISCWHEALRPEFENSAQVYLEIGQTLQAILYLVDST
jgi:hypothetical protein